LDVLLHAGAVLDAGRQDREAREIPTEQRQFLNTAPLDCGGYRRVIGLKIHTLCDYLHAIVSRPDLKHDIHTGFLLIRDVDSCLRLGSESLQSDGDCIVADFNQRERIIPGRIGFCVSLLFGGNSKQGDVGAGHHCPGGIRHSAEHLCGRGLSADWHLAGKNCKYY
jgi:hypothetical protein